MKLFTKEIDRMLFNQYPKGADLEDQVVVAKIFNPYGRGTWYIINSDPQDPDYLWVIADLFETEVGSASRSELEGIRIKIGGMQLGLERDLSFSPKNASEVLNGLLQGKHYKQGGKMAKGGNLDKKSDITVNGVEYVEMPYEKAKEMFETGEIEIMMIDSDELIQTVEYVDDLNDDGMIVVRLEDLKKSAQEFAKGGRITADNIESIEGKYMQVYSPGDEEPSIYYITSVKKSDPKFSRKSVTIQTDGGTFIIPEPEIVNLNSKGVTYKESGMKEPMMLYLHNQESSNIDSIVKTVKDLPLNSDYPQKYAKWLRDRIDDITPGSNLDKLILSFARYGDNRFLKNISDSQYDNLRKKIVRMDKTQDHEGAFMHENYNDIQLEDWSKQAVRNVFKIRQPQKNISYAVGGKITIRDKRYLDVVKKTFDGTAYRFTLQYDPTFKNYYIQVDSEYGSSNEYTQTIALLPPESAEVIESMVSGLNDYLKNGQPGV